MRWTVGVKWQGLDEGGQLIQNEQNLTMYLLIPKEVHSNLKKEKKKTPKSIFQHVNMHLDIH